MKKNINAMICSAVVLLSGAVFGDIGADRKNVTPFAQGDEEAMDMIPTYNHAARVNTTSDWDMFLTASFLYWDVYQEGMEIGPLFYTKPTASNVEPSGLLTFEDAYKPGFKVGLG